MNQETVRKRSMQKSLDTLLQNILDKSVRGQLRTADLEQENDRLRNRLRTYEDVISRNNLWHFFSGSRNKNRNRDDAR